ncbi:hypothetical protein GCM10010347_06810 [Streptomyces cirratus]|uniref:Integral membrane protein n=1 Tax=Streptomyces cirratus TaxID=68187 RepID=A0ABQ3EJG0_9ACTN|nr:hypothetical protein [Streptomyces cirratus]GHB39928.1 hypothetical protein GCM10010347_06810 [Streptomyces cirratus]
MELDKRQHAEPGDGCLVGVVRVPVKIVALIVVLPVRVVWDLLVAFGRGVRRHVLGPLFVYVLRPVLRGIAWALTVLLKLVFVWPWAGLWRFLVEPVYRHLLAPGGRLLYEHLLRPLGRALSRTGRGLLWLGGVLYRYVLTPVGHACAWTGTVLWRYLLRPVALGAYRYVLTPLGRALVWAWRVAGLGVRTVWRAFRLIGWVLVGWPLSRVYRHVLTPVGHVVREVWRTVRATVREVRADVRKVLFGGPGREPGRSRARTLGSTTAVGDTPARETPLRAPQG